MTLPDRRLTLASYRTRSLTRTLLWLLIGPVLPAVSTAITPFTIVLMPDTQGYVDDPIYFPNYQAQTQWILDNRISENIVFVSHVGDLVENGALGPSLNQAEWDLAVQAMDTLDGSLVAQPDGIIPYGTVAGNHDSDAINVKTPADQYVTHFGPARYAGRSWYQGASSDGINSAQIFQTEAGAFLHIGLEWHPSDAAIEWAQGVITDNPTLPTIVSTHEYLGLGNPAGYQSPGANYDASGDNDALSLREKLVEPYPQIFMVLSGHQPGDGRRASTTILGQPTREFLADYQFDPNGGNGWMRLLEFRPDSDVMFVEVFSPTYIPGVTAGTDRSLPFNQYLLVFDFDAHRDVLGSDSVLHFRQDQDAGYGVYTGAIDTYIGSGNNGFTLPNVSYENETSMRVDADQDSEQALVRFADLIGTVPGQVPPNAQIQTAILTFTTEAPFSETTTGAEVYRMTIPWDGSSTWNSLVGGVQIGTETEATFDFDPSSEIEDKGTYSFDVTASVQAWANGTPNHGWVFVGKGGDRWNFRTSDWEAIAERPMLTVRFSGPPVVPAASNAQRSLLLGLLLLAAAVALRWGPAVSTQRH